MGPFALRPTPHLEIMLIMEVVNFVIGHIGNTARLLTPTTIVGDEDLQQKGKGSTCKGSNSMDHIIVCMLSSVEKREKELTQAIRDFRETLEQTGTGNNIGFVF